MQSSQRFNLELKPPVRRFAQLITVLSLIVAVFQLVSIKAAIELILLAAQAGKALEFFIWPVVGLSVSIIFFLAALFSFQLMMGFLKRGRYIEIAPDGLRFSHGNGLITVPWSNVEKAGVDRMLGFDYLGIKFRDFGTFAQNSGLDAELRTWRNRIARAAMWPVRELAPKAVSTLAELLAPTSTRQALEIMHRSGLAKEYHIAFERFHCERLEDVRDAIEAHIAAADLTARPAASVFVSHRQR